MTLEVIHLEDDGMGILSLVVFGCDHSCETMFRSNLD